METPGLELVPLWDIGTTGSSLTYLATALALFAFLKHPLLSHFTFLCSAPMYISGVDFAHFL